MTVDTVPLAELGHPGNVTPAYPNAGIPAGYVVESFDNNPDLRFPLSIVVYDRMRKEDGQVGSVARAVTYPILNAGRRLVGGRPEVRAFIEAELGMNLDTDAGRRRRRREGIVLTDHLREALLSLWFGFMPFEQVYGVGPAAPGLEDAARTAALGTDLYVHLRKLAPRMPRTLSEIRVARDGGLAGVVQNPPAFGLPGASSHAVFIPVDRLVMYVNEKEGADWTGNSLLRAAYKHWLVKDALVRVGAQGVERNSMGVPVVTYPDPADRTKALKIAREFRAGSTAGIALGTGWSISVVGTSGSTTDGLPWVKYHDESIGRSLLAMFLNLGHDNGAKALGATFVDYFLLAINSVLRNLEETITEHVIRDLVELNYGPDEAYPVLKFDDLTAEATPTAEALKALADAKLITPNRETEQDLRRRYKMPALPELVAAADAVEEAATSPVAEVGIPALIGAGVITADEGRKMLKLPGAAPEATALSERTVVLPASWVNDLAGHRVEIRDRLGVAGDFATLADRAALLADRIIALREGHES